MNLSCNSLLLKLRLFPCALGVFAVKNVFKFLPALLLFVYSCNIKSKEPGDETPKGELAFLLQYQGRLPNDVGFLTNQVVQRRLANMMKDSFQVFMRVTKYDRPIEVSKPDNIVIAQFFSDSDRSMPSANVMIDISQDAIWVEYLSGDSIIEFTDHQSLPKPGLVPD
jgi:hypothetical protein